LIGEELLELGVLVLERAQPLGLVDLHAAELLLPAVVGLLGDAESAADVGGLGAGVDLLEGADDLLVGELALPGHGPSPE
jgi:hypothetical protein